MDGGKEEPLFKSSPLDSPNLLLGENEPKVLCKCPQESTVGDVKAPFGAYLRARLQLFRCRSSRPRFHRRFRIPPERFSGLCRKEPSGESLESAPRLESRSKPQPGQSRPRNECVGPDTSRRERPSRHGIEGRLQCLRQALPARTVLPEGECRPDPTRAKPVGRFLVDCGVAVVIHRGNHIPTRGESFCQSG